MPNKMKNIFKPFVKIKAKLRSCQSSPQSRSTSPSNTPQAPEPETSTAASYSPSRKKMNRQSETAPSHEAQESGSSGRDQPSLNLAEDLIKPALHGLYEMLKVVKESSDVLIPLKSVVGGVIACVEVYKKTSGNHEEMERLSKVIDQMIKILEERLNKAQDRKMLGQIIERLCIALETEIKKIGNMLKRGFPARLAMNSDDAGEIVTSYRAIKDALNNFNIELGLMMERNTHDILKHVVFQSLPRSRDAAYDAAINTVNLSRGPCTEDTRVDIIKQIMAWVKEADPAKAPSVYWLNGLGGLGKTTIAYTICERLKKANIPFSSIFCSAQLDSKNSKLLITTITRDLAELFSSYASEVLPVLQKDSKIADARLSRQIDELLAEPWESSMDLREGLPIPIVVVDALDEIENNFGTDFLRELLEKVQAGKLRGIKFLVTGRPEPILTDLCKKFPPNAVCKLHEVDKANVNSDIGKYLRDTLCDVADAPELATLASRADGFFIYAATIVRSLNPPRPPKPTTKERLKRLKNMVNWSATTGPRTDVDDLYEHVLRDAFGQDWLRESRLPILHTILCAESRIDMSVIAKINDTDLETVEEVVKSLYAVLFISSEDNCVYWYHTSFPDYMFSARAKFFTLSRQNHPSEEVHLSCDPSTHHAFLASRCFSIMHESLWFNICDIESSYLFDFEVPHMRARMAQRLTPTLRYASLRWASHLRQSTPAETDDNELVACLQQFMSDKLLFWIEAMNLIYSRYECSRMLTEAEDWVQRGKQIQPTTLLEYLADASQFSTYFAGSQAAMSTPHLYISALGTWNQQSLVWKTWKPRFPHIPLISLSTVSITVPLLTMTAKSAILCLAVSRKGDMIVSGSADGLVQVWHAKTGEQIKDLQGHTSSVNSVAFSPDGSRIISGSRDNSVRIWDAKTGEQLRELQGHTWEVNSVAFSPDGSRIVSGSWDESVRIWDAKTGDQLRELHGHTSSVSSVAFSPDGSRIVSGSWDESVRIWDAKTGDQLRELHGHTSSVSSVAFSPDGSHIISGSNDRSVRIWDAKTGDQLRELHGHTSSVSSVAFSPDGSRIVSGSRDKSVRIWDAKTGDQLKELQGHTNNVNSVTFSPDGSRILSGSLDKSVRIWDAKTGDQLRELHGHTSSVSSVAFSPDGSRIVSGSRDKSVRIWDAKTGDQLKELQGHTNNVNSVAFSPDGSRILSGSLDKSVRIWDAKTGDQLRELHGHTSWVSSVVFSPDGSRIVSGSSDRSVRIWDAKTGGQLKELQGYTNVVHSVAFSPDGSRIVSGSDDRSVRIWDAKTGEQLRGLQGHTDIVNSVAFSPDGSRIISGSWDKLVRIWDAKTDDQLRELQGHTDVVNSVAFSPDGSWILSGSEDKSIRIWANSGFNTSSSVMDHDGWIVYNTNRIIWIPSTIRNILHHPHSVLIISRQGSATVSFDDSKLGPYWHHCYSPHSPISRTQM